MAAGQHPAEFASHKRAGPKLVHGLVELRSTPRPWTTSSWSGWPTGCRASRPGLKFPTPSWTCAATPPCCRDLWPVTARFACEPGARLPGRRGRALQAPRASRQDREGAERAGGQGAGVEAASDHARSVFPPASRVDQSPTRSAAASRSQVATASGVGRSPRPA